jgi:lipopolysaccharide transport system ATP-binding protein
MGINSNAPRTGETLSPPAPLFRRADMKVVEMKHSGGRSPNPSRWQQVTCQLRAIPTVLCVGAMRCGTGTLWELLKQHPDYCAPFRKEINYFDRAANPNLNGYRSFFPLRSSLRTHSPTAFTTDISPSYLQSPEAAMRIRRIIGADTRLFVLLRDPVERAISHFNKRAKKGEEPNSMECSFEIAISDPKSLGYLRRGLYAQQIETYFEIFPREQILIGFSATLFSDPQTLLDQIADHFRIPRWIPPVNSWRGRGGDDSPPDEIVEKLRRYFQPHDEHLSRLLGVPLPWTRKPS